jgi:hypothetical protein
MARRGVKLPNSRAPPECYPSGTVGREGLRSADKRKAIQPDAGSPLTTSDDQEERGSLEQSSPSPQERNVHETPRGQLRVFVDIPSPSKSPVKKSRDCIIRAPGKIGMTEAEVTAWFLPTDDSPAAIEFIEKASSNAKQKTAWIIKIAKQKFAEMLGMLARDLF